MLENTPEWWWTGDILGISLVPVDYVFEWDIPRRAVSRGFVVVLDRELAGQTEGPCRVLAWCLDFVAKWVADDVPSCKSDRVEAADWDNVALNNRVLPQGWSTIQLMV